MEVDGAKIRIRFDSVGSGLMVGKKAGRAPTAEDKGGKLQRFAIAGDDSQVGLGRCGHRWRIRLRQLAGSRQARGRPLRLLDEPRRRDLYNREASRLAFRTDNMVENRPRPDPPGRGTVRVNANPAKGCPTSLGRPFLCQLRLRTPPPLLLFVPSCLRASAAISSPSTE